MLRLKNSKLDQNDDVLRIINCAFIQTVSLCCLHLLFSPIIHVVLHVRKNTDTALTVASHSQLLLFSRISRSYRSVVHVKSRKLGHRLSQELGVALPWLHCLNLLSTAPTNASMIKNASMLKNSKLDQNNGVLRIINSTFVQTASLCCLHSL